VEDNLVDTQSVPHAARPVAVCRLEPNAFRNDGQTMQARIEAMKEQNWSDSNDFLKVQPGALWLTY
jgi:hypothetical protein